MHEVALMQDLLDLAIDQSVQAGARRIERIALRVGAMSGVDPEALAFAFDVVTRGTSAEGARLDLERVPTACACLGCGLEFQPDGLPHICPACQSPRSRIVAGRELELNFLEVS